MTDSRLAELAESLVGQAQAVEDLEILVRDELRATREACTRGPAPPAERASGEPELRELLAEQGRLCGCLQL